MATSELLMASSCIELPFQTTLGSTIMMRSWCLTFVHIHWLFFWGPSSPFSWAMFLLETSSLLFEEHDTFQTTKTIHHFDVCPMTTPGLWVEHFNILLVKLFAFGRAKRICMLALKPHHIIHIIGKTLDILQGLPGYIMIYIYISSCTIKVAPTRTSAQRPKDVWQSRARAAIFPSLQRMASIGPTQETEKAPAC